MILTLKEILGLIAIGYCGGIVTLFMAGLIMWEINK